MLKVSVNNQTIELIDGCQVSMLTKICYTLIGLVVAFILGPIGFLLLAGWLYYVWVILFQTQNTFLFDRKSKQLYRISNKKQSGKRDTLAKFSDLGNFQIVEQKDQNNSHAYYITIALTSSNELIRLPASSDQKQIEKLRAKLEQFVSASMRKSKRVAAGVAGAGGGAIAGVDYLSDLSSSDSDSNNDYDNDSGDSDNDNGYDNDSGDNDNDFGGYGGD
jgi:hypothetical protein